MFFIIFIYKIWKELPEDVIRLVTKYISHQKNNMECGVAICYTREFVNHTLKNKIDNERKKKQLFFEIRKE